MGKGVTLSNKNDEDIEDIMRDKGLRLDDCYYMTSESPIDIKEL
jgi:hypothetical protein